MSQNADMGIVVPEKIAFETPLVLQSGQTLPRFDLMIETYGALNAEKNNAVLICHALSGNHHVAGRYSVEDKYPGWWDTMVGPGKPIDTNRFFVVGLNNLGGCHGSTGPLSINSDTGEEYGADFPVVTVKDWVKSQAMLSDYLGIEQWAAIVGGSLGGMQALQWTIDFPSRVRHALVIASATRLSAQNIAFNDVARQAILTDPEFHNGHYRRFNAIPRRGLRIARMMGHITYLAEEGLGKKFGRTLSSDGLSYGYGVEFEIESYLRYQGDKFAERFDGNTYLRMTKALDYFEPAAAFGNNLTEALKTVQAKFFVASFSTDWRFAPERSRALVKHLIKAGKSVQYIEVESHHGHDAFLMTDEPYIRAVRAYINNIYKELQA
ncbi:homoserine O-succinyltransferase MetX [Neisseria weaveri]|uniref:Homoserine O-succinyltransferase n=1 Tax=Neisseria weaveri TaxID=28091 RepID=A0A3S5F9W6_9NEIS|nr:homoserine O-acetyltransferase [Neisseria weaveri]EGV34772.1 homoserine O-acetyltransferase [Neisseria weaveri ATCC 51223]EGV38065.1 homoserine O-acetyltransferase [Neisseria weaveri LMG 5135]VEJ52106.1 homoserine O-acetyltransferase [Neisseria weaveri]